MWNLVKLMVLKCFVILYAQILFGFENRDIQDLMLFSIVYWVGFRQRDYGDSNDKGI